MIGSKYDAVLAPQNGVIPACVGEWWPKLQVQWFTKYLSRLRAQRLEILPWQRSPLLLDTYYVTSVNHQGVCCFACLMDSSGCDDRLPEQSAVECCHKDHTLRGS